MCLYPRLIENRKYKANKKNGGIIPEKKDQRTTYVPVGCSVCIECRKQKSREWMTRLQEDIKQHKNGKFVTLTYSTKGLHKVIHGEYKIQKRKNYKKRKWKMGKGPRAWKKPKLNSKKLEEKGYDLDKAVVIKSVRLFLERWRKKYGKSMRHWLVSELGHGQTEHVHLHGILWTDEIKEVEKIWGYGRVWIGHEKNGVIQNYVSNRTVSYIVKYITKMDEKHLGYKPTILTSAGIGNNYTKTWDAKKNRYNEEETNEAYRTSTGHKIALPIYWRNKIYTDEEREKLWIKKLDREERWVCGEKVDISKGNEDYYNLLEYHRNRTKKLGYPNPEIIWKKKNYEEARRKMIYELRLQQ